MDDTNTRFLAGLAMMRGSNPADALTNAIASQQQAQMNQAKLQQFQQEQYARQVLPQLMQDFNSNPQETIGKMISAGMDPKDAILLAKSLIPAAPKVQENLKFNPVTGEMIKERKVNGELVGYGSPNGATQAQNSGMSMSNQGQEMATAPYVAPWETPGDAMARRKQERDQVETYRVDAENATKDIPTINDIRYALTKFNTGPFSGAKLLANQAIKGVTGSDPFDVHPEYGELIKSKAAGLVMPLVVQNKGAASENDMKLFLESVPGLNTSKSGNMLIADGAEAIRLRQRELYNASKAYQNKYGTLEGFKQKWDQYADTNPIIQKGKDGLKLNKDNIGNWKGYVLDGKEQQSQNWSLEQLQEAKAAKVREREAQMRNKG